MAISIEGLVIGVGIDARAELDREFEAHLAESPTLAFRLAYSVLRSREEAEDVAQEALTRAYRQFHRLRDRTKFRSWLTRTAWRLALDRVRANRRRSVRETGHAVPEQHASTVEDVEQRERADALWRAIDALPGKLRLVIVLANMEGHGTAEVASLLGIPEGTVKSRLFDARRRLKDALSWMHVNHAR
jgi:RNA polymerase sigma-70 factor (ECF subfamily)